MDKSTPKPKTVMKKRKRARYVFVQTTLLQTFFFIDIYYNVQFFFCFCVQEILFFVFGVFDFCDIICTFNFFIYFLIFSSFLMISGKKPTQTKLHLRQNSFDWDLKHPILTQDFSHLRQIVGIRVLGYLSENIAQQSSGVRVACQKEKHIDQYWKCQNVGLAHNEKC